MNLKENPVSGIVVLNKFLLLLTSLVFSSSLLAAGAGPVFSYYSMILDKLGITDPHVIEEWKVVIASLVSLLVIAILGWIYSVSCKRNGSAPQTKVGVPFFVESVLSIVDSLGHDVIGHGYEKHLGLLSTLFIFIFISNLSGLIPGVTPATDSISTNLAMGAFVFVIYNYNGFKEHGTGYLKHFLGPIWWLAPLMLVIEIVGHFVRPVSLSLRLYGNIFGDHLVLSVFGGLVPLVVPAVFMVFGLLVASVQSFVFTLLTSIYIALATSHDH